MPESVEQRKERTRRWRERNRQKIRDYAREWRLKRGEKQLAYGRALYRKNPGRFKASKQKWKANHPEYYAQYYQRNKERLLARKKKRYEENRSKYVHRATMELMARRNIDGSYSEKEWEELKAIYNNTCPRCFKSEPEITLTRDHKIPISRGGMNYLDNIQPLCKRCNGEKHAKTWFASCPINFRVNVNGAL